MWGILRSRALPHSVPSRYCSSALVTRYLREATCTLPVGCTLSEIVWIVQARQLIQQVCGGVEL